MILMYKIYQQPGVGWRVINQEDIKNTFFFKKQNLDGTIDVQEVGEDDPVTFLEQGKNP